METHAHHLHKAPGQKFWHFFFEFLMLFLAVSAGFFVENLREHHLEREREEQYMKSLVNDLKTDVTNIDTMETRMARSTQDCDSLSLLLSLPDYSAQTSSIYYRGRRISFRWFFNMTDGTLKQLNNAGGMRLIEHQDVVDSIQSYENLYSELEKIQQIKELELRDYRDIMCRVFDVRIFETMVHGGDPIIRPVGNPKLFSQNPGELNELLMRAHYIKRANGSIYVVSEDLKQKAINLQELIKKYYHVE